MSRLLACPASYALSRDVGVERTSPYAAEGTVAHALAADILNGTGPEIRPGAVIEQDGHSVVVTSAMLSAVLLFVDTVCWRAADAEMRLIEHSVRLDAYWPTASRPAASLFGTADAIAYSRTRAHLDVLDFKFGVRYVKSTDNPQLLFYAAGALLVLPPGAPCATVSLTIVQPRVAGCRAVRTCTLAAVDVLAWVEDTLKPLVADALHGQAAPVPGLHCYWCPARVACPAQTEAARTKALAAFALFDDDN